MTAEQIVQIVMYVLVGIASIASAVISYIKTGSWNKATVATAKSVDSQLNELNSNILCRLDSLESRLESISEDVDDLEPRVETIVEDVDELYVNYGSLSKRVNKIEKQELS